VCAYVRVIACMWCVCMHACTCLHVYLSLSVVYRCGCAHEHVCMRVGAGRARTHPCQHQVQQGLGLSGEGKDVVLHQFPSVNDADVRGHHVDDGLAHTHTQSVTTHIT
jgi:hypothetical protein